MGAVELKLEEGRGSIRGLEVANPAGYSPGSALSFGELTLEMDKASRAVALVRAAAPFCCWACPWARPYRHKTMHPRVCLMLGAVANHLKVGHPMSRSAPALVLLALCGLMTFRLWGPEVWLPW